MTQWLAALSAYWFASSFKWFILLAVVLPTQVERVVPIGQRNSAWGMVFGLGAIWAVIGPSLFGYWSDRLGKRSIFILWGGGLTLVALLVLATAHSLWQLAAGYLLLQISDDVGTGPYDAVIPDLVPKKMRGAATGFVNVSSLLGQMTVAIFALLLKENTLAVYGLIAGVTVIGAVVTNKAMRMTGQELTPQPHPLPFFKGLLRGWIAPWKHHDFAWVWFTRFLFSLGLYLVQPYLKFYISDSVDSFLLFGRDFGGAAGATSILVLTISIAGAISAVFGGTLSDRIGRRKVIYLSGGMMAVTLLPFLVAHSLPILWALSMFFGLGFGAYLSASMAMAMDVLPDEDSHGKDMGIWQMSISSVQIIAGSAGLMVDYGNRVQPLLGYQVTFGFASVLFLLGTALVRNVRTHG